MDWITLAVVATFGFLGGVDLHRFFKTRSWAYGLSSTLFVASSLLLASTLL